MPWVGPQTAIQFVSFGNPFIYCAQISQSQTSWMKYTVSSSSFLKGNPVAYHFANSVYIAYAELHNDTIQVKVYKKEGNNFTLEWIQYISEGSSVHNWSRFVQSNGQLHFFHTYDKSDHSQPLTHMVKSLEGWKELPIENREEYLYELIGGDDIDVDSDGNFYFLNRDIFWVINTDNIYYEYRNPHDGPYYDLALIDDEIYLYFIAGNKNFPFGDPVMFYEALASLSATTQIENQPELTSARLYSNPGNGLYNLELQVDRTFEMINVQRLDTEGKNI